MIRILALGLLAAGCGGNLHLTESHGRSYQMAFERQQVNPNAGATAKTPKGLDSHEAAIVSDTYRAQLAPQGGGDTSDQLLLIGAPRTYGSPAPAVTTPPAR